MTGRKTYRKQGSGYGTPIEYFNPNTRQPSTTAPALTSAPTPGWVRPPMAATNVVSPNTTQGSPQSGGWACTRRLLRKMEGGFAPVLMGSFVANAQSAAVPLALYGLYSAVVPKKGVVAKPVSKGGNASRKLRRGTTRRA